MEGGIVILLLIAALYFLPWLCALMRGRTNTGSIFLLNLFLGWTLVGWVVALVWAFAHDPMPRVVSAGGSAASLKKCPQCAELILREAKKCKHCGSAV